MMVRALQNFFGFGFPTGTLLAFFLLVVSCRSLTKTGKTKLVEVNASSERAHRDGAARMSAYESSPQRPTSAAPEDTSDANRIDGDHTQRRYLRLMDISLHESAPDGLYVAGTQDLDGYYPTGPRIEGEGLVGYVEGTPGWLELLDLRFYPAMTARAPARPYVEGINTEHGFVPTSRRIHY